MYRYAHVGDATDNAFTTLNGEPIREFVAFHSTADRKSAQDAIFTNSDGSKNVIACTRDFVSRWLGGGFEISNRGMEISGVNMMHCRRDSMGMPDMDEDFE